MDTNGQQDDGSSSHQKAPDIVKSQSITHHLIFSLVSLIVLIIGMGSVYLWQHQKVNSLNKQVSNMQSALIKDSRISLDNLEARTALPNIVVDSANSPADLIAFLGSDNTQCYKASGTGYYKVIAQVNDTFAEMQYGCTAKGGTSPQGASASHILAKKVNNSWILISPTNQWLPFNGQDIPSCTMVNNSKVSKLVTPKCWEGPALVSPSYNIGKHTEVDVANP